MVEAEIEGVEFLAINTDLQSLQQSSAHETLHIGDALTHGLGSGSNPELGRAAAREEYDRIKAILRGSDMVFIAAGAGGGTGTGTALVGIGMGTGDRRAIEAAERAVASPLLETSMDGARSILLSITGGPDLSLWEVNESAKTVAEAAHPDANIIFGAMVDEKLDDQVWVTVVATGFGNGRARRVERPAAGERSTLREPNGEPRVS